MKKLDCVFEIYYSTDESVKTSEIKSMIHKKLSKLSGRYVIANNMVWFEEDGIWGVEIRADLKTLYKIAPKLGSDKKLVDERTGNTLSKNCDENWKNDKIQFPRLLAELNSGGAIAVNKELCQNMDLTAAQIYEILDRADTEWQKIKYQLLA